MTYKVRVTPKAIADLESYTDFIAKDSKDRAKKWLTEAWDLINSLSSMPRRFPVIPESDLLGEELRHIIHYSHHIIYRILENEMTVDVVRVWPAPIPYPTHTPQNHPK